MNNIIRITENDRDFLLELHHLLNKYNFEILRDGSEDKIEFFSKKRSEFITLGTDYVDKDGIVQLLMSAEVQYD